MELKKYIKTILKPSVAKRAKAMKMARRNRKGAALAEDKDYGSLEKLIGYSFKDKSLLREALTHPGSVGFEKKVKSNQRLEFLGDAILQAVVTDAVFRKFPDDEGKLTKIRIALTQGSFLTGLSRSLGIPQRLILPKGAEDIRESASAAEDAFEALVGAIYLDSDFASAHSVVLSWYRRKLDELPDLVRAQNPKGALQEIAARRGDSVSYALVSQSGPDHRKVFEVEVVVNGSSLARASASSKKSAEIKAARAALKDYPESADAGDSPAKKRASGGKSAGAEKR